MAQARTLKMTIEVEDEGGPDDYNQIMNALRSIGADVIEEVEVQ